MSANAAKPFIKYFLFIICVIIKLNMFIISLLRVRKHLIYKSIDVAKIGIIIDNRKTFIDKLKTFNIYNEESSYDFRNCFYLWTSQGLNLGPPDYESVLHVFHEITNNVKALKINALTCLTISKNFVNLQQFSGEKVT